MRIVDSAPPVRAMRAMPPWHVIRDATAAESNLAPLGFFDGFSSGQPVEDGENGFRTALRTRVLAAAIVARFRVAAGHGSCVSSTSQKPGSSPPSGSTQVMPSGQSSSLLHGAGVPMLGVSPGTRVGHPATSRMQGIKTKQPIRQADLIASLLSSIACATGPIVPDRWHQIEHHHRRFTLHTPGNDRMMPYPRLVHRPQRSSTGPSAVTTTPG